MKPDCPWKLIEQRGKQTELVTGSDSSGIKIVINKKRRTLMIYGWYDHFVGVQGGGEIGLDELIALFEGKRRGSMDAITEGGMCRDYAR